MPGGGEEAQEKSGEQAERRDEEAQEKSSEQAERRDEVLQAEKTPEAPTVATPSAGQPEVPAPEKEVCAPPKQTSASLSEPVASPAARPGPTDGVARQEGPPVDAPKQELAEKKLDSEVAESPQEQELLIRVPFEIELPASSSVSEFLAIVKRRLEEAKLQPTKDVSEYLLGISGQTVEDPKAQPFKYLVPGSVVSLVEEHPEAAEVASLGLCLNARLLHLMQAQSQLLGSSQAVSASFPSQPSVPTPPPLPVPAVEQASAIAPSSGSQAVADIRAQVQREQRERFYKTRMCMNYAQGLCTYGPRCTFAHGDRELRVRTEGAALSMAAVAPSDAPQVAFGDSTSGGASSSWDNGKSNWDNSEQWSSWKSNWKREDWKDAGWQENDKNGRDDSGWYQNSSGSGKWGQDQDLDKDLANYSRGDKDHSNSKDSWAPDSWASGGSRRNDHSESGGNRRNEHAEEKGYGSNGAKARSLSRGLRRSDRGEFRDGDLRHHREDDVRHHREDDLRHHREDDVRHHREDDARAGGRSSLRSSTQTLHRSSRLQRDHRDDSADRILGSARSSTRREGDMRIQESRRTSDYHSEMHSSHRSRASRDTRDVRDIRDVRDVRDRVAHRDVVASLPRKDSRVPPPPRKEDDDDEYTYSEEEIIEECDRSRSDRYGGHGGDVRYRDVRDIGSRRDREVYDRHGASRSHRSSGASRYSSHYDSVALSSGRSEGRRHSDRLSPPVKRLRR